MTRRQFALLSLALAAALVAVVVLLATGGTGVSDVRIESPGDVTVDDAPQEPLDTALADLLFAEVRSEGEQLVFEVRLNAEIPRRLRNTALDLRWDIYEGPTATWMVAANFDVGPVASVVNQDATFGVSTFDHSLAGEISRDGDRLLIRFDPRSIEGFPEVFSWQLSTMLDGAPANPSSALARDRAPDEGRRAFPEG